MVATTDFQSILDKITDFCGSVTSWPVQNGGQLHTKLVQMMQACPPVFELIFKTDEQQPVLPGPDGPVDLTVDLQHLLVLHLCCAIFSGVPILFQGALSSNQQPMMCHLIRLATHQHVHLSYACTSCTVTSSSTHVVRCKTQGQHHCIAWTCYG